MYFDEFKHQLPDIDPAETDDWLASLDQVVEQEGEMRARFLIYKLLKRARQLQIGLPPLTQTRYINTISPEQEPYFPGDEELERRIRRLIRWNAVAMVLRANNRFAGIGGHLATYASAATLYEVGFNHFFRGKDGEGSGRPDLLPGSCRTRDLRAGVPRGPAEPSSSSTTSGARRARTPGLSLVSASPADARLLGVPDGLHGTGSHRRHLPGPLQPLPPEPRPGRHLGFARLGIPRRRRDRRAGIARRPPRRRPGGARQPDLRRQLQPPAARRPRPRQRQDHPGARVGLPRRRLERHQGHLGPRVGRAARPRRRRRPRPEDERHPRRRVPEVLGRRRRLYPRAFLRSGPATPQARRPPLGRRSRPSSAAAATTIARSTRPTRRRPSTRAPRR